MTADPPATIRIAAALIEDARGRLLLVRKTGTIWFMQPGGKIEPGETALAALRRELREEIGVVLAEHTIHPLGRFDAPAANEPDHRVEAELFRLCLAPQITTGAEIAEVVWVDPAGAARLPLAPLTRDHVLPLCGTS